MFGFEWCAPALFTKPAGQTNSANDVKARRPAAWSGTSIAIGATCSALNATVRWQLTQPTVVANSPKMAAPIPLPPPVKKTASRRSARS
jgi:hypothetical protein